MNQEAVVPVGGFIEKNRTYHAGPGTLLRQAREEAQLSIEEVASQLRLSPQIILDIEDDNYGNMLFTFTRGYLRAYARLLELSAEDIISAFNSLELAETPRPQSPLAQGVGKGAKLKDRNSSVNHERVVRWVSFIVVIALLVLVGLWWHSSQNSSSFTAPLSHILGSHTQTTTSVANASDNNTAINTTVSSTSATGTDKTGDNTAMAAATNDQVQGQAQAASTAAASTNNASNVAAATPVTPAKPQTPTEVTDGASSIVAAAAPDATAQSASSATTANNPNNVAAQTNPATNDAQFDPTTPAATSAPVAAPAANATPAPAKPKHYRHHPQAQAALSTPYGEIVPEPYSNNQTSGND